VTSAVLTFFVVPSAFWLFERRHYQERVLGLHGPQIAGALEKDAGPLALTEGAKE